MEEIQNLFIEYDNAVRDTTEFFNCEKEEIDKKLQQESDDLETLQKKQFTEAIEIYNSRKERLEKSVADIMYAKEKFYEVLKKCWPEGVNGLSELLQFWEKESLEGDTVKTMKAKYGRNVYPWKNNSAVVQHDNEPLIVLVKQFINLSEELEKKEKELQKLMELEKRRSIEKSEKDKDVQQKTITQNYKDKRQEVDIRLKKQAEAKYNKLKKDIEAIGDKGKMEKEVELVNKTVPSFDNFVPPSRIVDTLRFGSLCTEIKGTSNDKKRRNILSETFNEIYRETKGKNSTISVPYGHLFTDSDFSSMIIFDYDKKKETVDFFRLLILRSLMSAPCGKMRFTMIDPIELGGSFSMFLELEEKSEGIVGQKIWSSETEIEEQLRMLVDDAANITQRCLQGKYKDIVEYNQEAGKNGEPYRMLFIMDFPNGFSARALTYLRSIVNIGPNCGIFVFVAGAVDEIEQDKINPYTEAIFEKLHKIYFLTEKCYLEENEDVCFLPDFVSDVKMVKRIFERLQPLENADVTIEEITNDLPRHKQYWFQIPGAQMEGLDIPVGIVGVNNIVKIHFGGQGDTKQNALMVGVPRAGKSNFIHVILVNTILQYSPEDVQIYLLDYKDGVEFKDYANYGLKNFRAISVESEPEFGLAVLRELKQEMIQRAKDFRAKNVSEIEDFYKIAEEKSEIKRIPRLLLIIDEYHRILLNPDDPVCKNCAELLQELVTLGPAFGIHLFLATQDMAQAKALDKNIYSKFKTRIVFPCSSEIASQILESGNMAIESIAQLPKKQALVNMGFGQKDFNRYVRIAHFVREEHRNLLICAAELQKERYMDLDNRMRLLLSNPEDDANNILSRFANGDDYKMESRGMGYPLYIGESLAMVNSCYPQLGCRKGQNLLLALSNEDLASCFIVYACMSIMAYEIQKFDKIAHPLFTVFDFSSTFYSNNSLLHSLCDRFPQIFRLLDRTEVNVGLEIHEDELERYKNHSGYRHFAIFLGINKSKRFTQSDGYIENNTMKMFLHLLSKGPEQGINSIVWANDPSRFLDTFGRHLELFEHRYAGVMDKSCAKALVGEEIPDNMREHNVMKYDLDAENQKIRVYSYPTENWVKRFTERIQRYIEI